MRIQLNPKLILVHPIFNDKLLMLESVNLLVQAVVNLNLLNGDLVCMERVDHQLS